MFEFTGFLTADGVRIGEKMKRLLIATFALVLLCGCSPEKRIYVRLQGNHPHTGKRGYLLSTDGEIEMSNVLGTSMVKVYLLDDHTDACYAELNHLGITLQQNSQPVHRHQGNEDDRSSRGNQ